MESIQTKFKLDGMHCQSCEKIVSKRIGKIPEVFSVAVSLETSEVSVVASKPISESEIQQALSDTEYTITK